METKESKELRWIEQANFLLDSAIRVPGTNLRFGLDPIIGLIPVAGELVTFGMSALLIWTMRKHGIGSKLVFKMILNTVLDAMLGSIPVIGNLFDFGFKANKRNVQLLREYHYEGKHRGNAWGLWIAVVLLVVGWIVAMGWLLWKLFEWIGTA
jgi:hypothetical protein